MDTTATEKLAANDDHSFAETYVQQVGKKVDVHLPAASSKNYL
jgi:hypothetical protein